MPTEDSVSHDPFVKLMGRLALAECHEEDMVTRTVLYFNDSLQAPGAGLRSECRCRMKEIVDLIPGVVLIQNE